MSFILDIERGGIRDILRTIDTLDLRLRKRVQDVVERYAALIARDGQGGVAVDEGDLRSTIRTALGRFAAEVLAGGIPGDATGELVTWADVVELGQLSNPNYPAQPFLGPAFETHRAAFVRDLQEAATP